MKPRFLYTLLSILTVLCTQLSAQQQDATEAGARKLFEEDTRKFKERQSAQVGEYMKSDKAPAEEVNFKAASIEVLKETSQIKGGGGVLISGHNVQVESDEALYNSDSKDASLDGNVRITGDLGVIGAQSGTFNLDNETGKFQEGSYLMEDGAYTLNARELDKVSEFELELQKSFFSTCQCSDDAIPWSIRSSRCSVTQESYAHCYWNRLEFYDVPVMYIPYFAFPVKTERASGLLVPTFGISDRDGFQYRQPLYLVLDDYSDMTLIPFTETQTRTGSFLDYRRAFSTEHSLSSRFLYSDERARGTSLRGSNIDGIFDPTVDKDRFGGFYLQKWRSEEDALIPASMVLDGHYVSDNLLLKEIDNNGIALESSRYVTSTGMLSAMLAEYGNMELLGEYNQSILTDQKLVFQRLPEFRINGLKSWRPFGTNPLGLKLVTRAAFDVTEFSREQFYEGRRTDFNPGFSVPFHYRNFFNSTFEGGVHATTYNLSNRTDPSDPAKIWEERPARTVPNFSYKIGTGVERVYRLDEDSWLADLTNIGAQNQGTRLARLKHTVEPALRYLYVPDVQQDDIPEFDQLDRIREKSLFLYGFTTRMYGRFLPVRGSEDTIPEITPEVDELPEAEIPSLLEDLGGPRMSEMLSRPVRTRKGDMRQLASFSLLEGYNLIEARQNQTPDRNAFTDLTAALELDPTRSLNFGFSSTWNREDAQFTSWEADTKLRDDRGDRLTARYSFMDRAANPYSPTEEDLSQLQAGAEIVLTDRLRFGYFTRYDAPTGTFIESLSAVRLLSTCNCWALDFGYSLETNPDREKYLITFTFGGLGGITQAVPYMGYKGYSSSSDGG